MYKIPNKKLLENQSWLENLYINQTRNTEEIGQIIGCSKYSVLRALKTFNIPIRTRTNKFSLLNNKNWVVQKYIKEKLSLNQIAKIVGSTPGNVWTILKKLGITTRNYKNGLLTRFPKGRKGKNTSNWRGGICSKNILGRSTNQAKEWRKAVFERDNYTCQLCNQHGGNLEADHIKQYAYYPQLRYILSNGRTLCKACHKNTPTHSHQVKK